MKYLGVDFGLRRVGLAISEGILATPFKTVEIRSTDDALVKMFQIIKSEKIDSVVVGMPEGKIGKLVKKFIKKLRQTGISVTEGDETLSTQMALKEMIALDLPKGKRKATDATAAAIILQKYIESLK